LQTLLPIVLGHFPTSTSSLTAIHFAQCTNAEKFQKFDHGEAKAYTQTSKFN
jgi:hypothetical protein